MQTRPSRRVLLFQVLVSRPRANGAVRAADSARSLSLRDYRQPINPTGRNACAEHGAQLDDIAGGTVFLGIRTIQERGGGWCRSMLLEFDDEGSRLVEAINTVPDTIERRRAIMQALNLKTG